MDFLKARGADSYETALSPADFGLANLKMSLVHAKKAGATGDGCYYYIAKKGEAPAKAAKAPDPENRVSF